MTNTVLSINNISKVYKDFKALDNVSINIEKGDIYGLVGNNGAGKSTLMRLVSGQSIIESGNISLFNSSNNKR